MTPPTSCPIQYDRPCTARFATLIKHTRPSAEAFARRLCHSSEETKDLLQDASVVAWRYFPQLHDETKFGSLLFQIVKQQYIHRKRSKDRHKPFTGELPADETLVTEVPQGNLFEANLDLSEALVTLKQEEREIVLLKWAGFTLGELARIYGCSISCMNMRLRRAKEAMREYLHGGSGRRGVRDRLAEGIMEETERLTKWAEAGLAVAVASGENN
jgi:RNA polymerase sigma factor (sigma-70 family)